MSERRKTHNGRDLSGHFRVKQVDIEDLEADPKGQDFIRDDLRLGGAIADTGPHAGERGVRIGEMIEKDRRQRTRAKGKTGRRRRQ